MNQQTLRRLAGALRDRLPAVVAFVVGLVSFVVYATTAARHVYWGDSAEFVAVARTLGIAHPPGYPLYTLLSALAIRVPVGTLFFRLSLLSAAAGAGAAAVVALLAWELSGRPPGRAVGALALPGRVVGSCGAGLAFALAATPWSRSTVPEVYSLSSFLVFSVLLFLVVWLRWAGSPREASAPRRRARGLGDRALPLAALMLGLALAHHLTALFLVPSVIVAVWWGARRSRRAASVAAAVILLLFGLSLYAYLPLRAAHDPAVLWANVDSRAALFAHVTGAQYAPRLLSWTPSLALLELRRFATELPGELSWVILAAAGLGAVALWRRSRLLVAILALEAGLVVAHAATYRIPDVSDYYVPVYGLLAAFAGVGIAAAIGAGRLRTGARPAVAAAVALVVAASLAVGARESWPERDLSDRRGAEVFARRLLDSAEGGIVLAQNDRTVFLLWHARFVEGRRPDLAIIDVRGRARHFEKWFPWVRFPTEQELAQYFGWREDLPCDPPAREALSVGAYAPLLVALNQDSLAIYADVDLARSVFPMRSLPSGLLARVTPNAVATIPRKLVRRAIGLDERAGGERGRALDRSTARAYAKVIGDYGELFLVRGETDDAIEALERSRDLAPEIPQAHCNLGVAYLSAGRLEEGIRAIGAALARDPGLAAAHYSLSALFLRMNEVGRAIGELEAAARFDRTNLRYRLELAALYERAGRAEDADEWYRGLVTTDPQSSAVRLAYGDFLTRQRRYAEAVAAYGSADELSPGSPGILCNLGRCYWELADTERAIEAMRKSVELQPQNARLKYDLALMFHCTGRPDEALPLLDQATRILPDMWEARALKATILGEGGDYTGARRLFEEAWELGADDPSFWGAWSAMESAAGDSARATEVARGLQ
jgi:tetratricopeptide (TPR) repeat protein